MARRVVVVDYTEVGKAMAPKYPLYSPASSRSLAIGSYLHTPWHGPQSHQAMIVGYLQGADHC